MKHNLGNWDHKGLNRCRVGQNSNLAGTNSNKENNVFKDGIVVKGLRFKLHGNNHGNPG